MHLPICAMKVIHKVLWRNYGMAKKKRAALVYNSLRGPTWARTKDPLIMSQVL